jgi:hypothetical protein
MRRRLIALLVALAALAAPAGAVAHPLGNFTINRFAALEASGSELYVHYVLDFAEIPAFQEGARVRSPGFATDLGRRLVLTVDRTRAPLEPLGSRAGSSGDPAPVVSRRFASTPSTGWRQYEAAAWSLMPYPL